MPRTFLAPLPLLLAGCRPAGPAVASAEEIGVVEQSALVQGRDGGGSARAWGRSIWTFGDTALNVEDEDGVNWHHNSYAMTEDEAAGDGLSGFWEPLDGAGAPRHLIPPSPQEQAFNLAHWGEGCAEEPCGARWAVWPGEPLWDEESQRALVIYGLIYAEPGDFDFEGVGSSVAIWSDPDGQPQRPVIDPEAEHPDLMWGAGGPSWAAARIEGGHLYAFACDSGGLSCPCALARAPLDAVQDASAWRYRAGDGWTAERAGAEELFDGAPIMSVSFSEHLGEYLAVYSENLGDRVFARAAPELWGPWSREAELFTVDADGSYDAVHHAEYEEDGGRVQYVTYSRSTGEGWFGAELPLVRVVFE